MGAGSFGAGRGPAGADPVYVPAPPVANVLPRSIRFDPSTKTFVQNTDGSMADIHPIDQQVALLLFVEQNSVPSQPSLGTRLRARITRVAPNKIPDIALDEVRQTLKPLITNKDILLVSVTTDTSIVGKPAFAVVYVNLRDPQTSILNPLSSAVRVVV